MRPHVYFHQLSSQTLWWAHATTKSGQGTMEPTGYKCSDWGRGMGCQNCAVRCGRLRGSCQILRETLGRTRTDPNVICLAEFRTATGCPAARRTVIDVVLGGFWA